MEQQLDAKKHVIIPILDKLRNRNISIGYYDKSILNENFQYAVKLSNGRILLSLELVEDFELNPNFVTEEQYNMAIQNFIPSIIATHASQPPLPHFTAPIEEKKPEPKPIPKEESRSTYYEPPKKKYSIKTIFFIVAIVVLGIVGFTVYNNTERQARINQEDDTKASIRNNITAYVKVSRSEYSYTELGGIYGLSITVHNNSSYILDNVKVKVKYIKANGEIWKEEFVDFNYIPAYKQMTIKAPDSNRGTSVSYEIASIKSNALGLY
jgi:hypothetical protein